MKTKKPIFRIVLLSRPVSVEELFLYFLLKNLKKSDYLSLQSHKVRWSNAVKPKVEEVVSESGILINLSLSNKKNKKLIKDLLTSNKKFGKKHDHIELVYKSIFGKGKSKNKLRLTKWLKESSLCPNAEIVIKAGLEILENIKDGEIRLTFPDVKKPEKITGSFDSKTFLLLPVLNRRKRLKDTPESVPDDQVIDVAEKELSNKNATVFSGARISIGIFGPPDCGKSTFAASLSHEIECLFKSLKSHKGDWSKLNLSAECISLDRDPVSERIVNKKTKKKKHKIKWTEELAVKLLQKMDKVMKNNSIVVADFPGKVTNITEILTANVRYGMIVTDDYRKNKMWEDLLERSGISVVGRVKKVRYKNSQVTTFNSGDRVSGRLQNPSRVERGSDPLIRTMAVILVLDIISKRILSERRKVRRMIKNVD